MSKLLIGGLSTLTDGRGLRAAFSAFGEVTKVEVVVDQTTGKSRGFGFVTFQDSREASSALSMLDGTMIDGHTIRVGLAPDPRRCDGRRTDPGS
ncbi:MAG: RNA-binding protein [Deltaproteobacteria bacterium]|nr:MAG: RNA-binding protein [Deltaproteobacteria bacterium]